MTTTLSHTDATRLDGAQRLTFLPSLFSSDFMLSELSVYAYHSLPRNAGAWTSGSWWTKKVTSVKPARPP